MHVAIMDGNLIWRKSGFESPVKWEMEVLCYNGIIFFVVVGFKTSCIKKKNSSVIDSNIGIVSKDFDGGMEVPPLHKRIKYK